MRTQSSAGEVKFFCNCVFCQKKSRKNFVSKDLSFIPTTNQTHYHFSVFFAQLQRPYAGTTYGLQRDRLLDRNKSEDEAFIFLTTEQERRASFWFSCRKC